MVKHKPKDNVIYTLVIPETGRIISIRLLNVSEKNRLKFLNIENNNTLDFHPSRFSYLYEKCKVKESLYEGAKKQSLTLDEPKTRLEKENIQERAKAKLANVKIFISKILAYNLGYLKDELLDEAQHCEKVLEKAIEIPSWDVTASEKYNSLVRDIKFLLGTKDIKTLNAFSEVFKETKWEKIIKI